MINIISGATRVPAALASMAERVNARVLLTTGLKPSERAAISLALTARIASPHWLRCRRANSASATIISRAQHSARPTVGSSGPKSGIGIPIRPFEPPVTSRHSIRTWRTTSAKAMVIIARNGPLTRNAGIASSPPITPHTSMAASIATPSGTPFMVSPAEI